MLLLSIYSFICYLLTIHTFTDRIYLSCYHSCVLIISVSPFIIIYPFISRLFLSFIHLFIYLSPFIIYSSYSSIYYLFYSFSYSSISYHHHRQENEGKFKKNERIEGKIRKKLTNIKKKEEIRRTNTKERRKNG